jgi:hypothetical protein
MNKHKSEADSDREPTIEERLARVEMLMGLRPHGKLLRPGEPGPPSCLRNVPGPSGSTMTVMVGG